MDKDIESKTLFSKFKMSAVCYKLWLMDILGITQPNKLYMLVFNSGRNSSTLADDMIAIDSVIQVV